MALQDQLAQTFGYTDIAVKNYGVTDIAANVGVALDRTNYVGDGTHNEIGVVITTNGASPVAGIGVTMQTIKAGQTGTIRSYGPIVQVGLYLASGSVLPGDFLDWSATAAKNGKVAPHIAGKITAGIAVSGTAVDGDPVLMMLCALAPNA